MSPRLLRPRAGFSPRNISGLALWLDAADQGTLFDATSGGSAVAADGAVRRWADKSAAGLAATNGLAVNNQPIRKVAVQNGRDALRFDGVNDSLQVSAVTLQTFLSVFIVSSTTRTATNLKFWLEHGADLNSIDGFFFNGTNAGAWGVRRTTVHGGPSTDNADWIGTGWALASFTYDGDGRIYKNNQLISIASHVGTSRSNSNVTAALNIASRNQASLFLTGDIGEIVVYNKVLNVSERDYVSKGLMSKWGLS